MIRRELIEKISKYFKLTDFEAEKIFDDFFNSIMEGVKNEKIVEIENLGEFIIRHDGQDKSVEFLAKQVIEDEVNAALSGTLSSSVSHSESSGRVTADEHAAPEDIEQELKKKREAILNKLAGPPVTEDADRRTEPPKTKEQIPEGHSEKESVEEVQSGQQGNLTEENLPDDESRRSFSDYFSVVASGSGTSVGKEDLSQTLESSERVIPSRAVDLHGEIVSNSIEQEKGTSVPSGYRTEEIVADHRTNGKPYYIWYRDSEPSPQETQLLSVEYELLYQAQKEAEYRSKLKIYVTSFIVFFSVVLILLIFSPVIYKVFFTPSESEGIETVGEEIPDEEISSAQNPSAENPPPVSGTQEQQPQQVPSQQTEVPQTEQPIPGLSKTSIGWTDTKYSVTYIILDNNKYAIQESAWESEGKALNRIKFVESLNIAGMKGSIERIGLDSKGVWYRVRFGEFATIEEARQRAIELRNKD